MTDDALAMAFPQVGEGTSASRCPEFTRTDRGWERCHRDEHNPDALHHVRDRAWSTAGNTPRLRFGQPCTQDCTWPDQVLKYRGRLSRPA
jgi:hypothetical protein